MRMRNRQASFFELCNLAYIICSIRRCILPEPLADMEQQRAVVLRQISELEDFVPARLPGPMVDAVIRVAISTARTIRVIARSCG